MPTLQVVSVSAVSVLPLFSGILVDPSDGISNPLGRHEVHNSLDMLHGHCAKLTKRHLLFHLYVGNLTACINNGLRLHDTRTCSYEEIVDDVSLPLGKREVSVDIWAR